MKVARCTHAAPDECPDCSGQRGDERELGRAAREAAKSRVPLTREQLHELYLANREALRGAP